MKNNDGFIKIIEHYGVMTQLKYFQSEIFELNEAIINAEHDGNQPLDEEIDHIAEEIADVLVMINQFIHYYNIDIEQIQQVMEDKLFRQLHRIEEEEND